MNKILLSIIMMCNSYCIASDNNQNHIMHTAQFLARYDNDTRRLEPIPENPFDTVSFSSIHTKLHRDNIKIAREMGIIFPDSIEKPKSKILWRKLFCCFCVSNSAVIFPSRDN